MFLRKTFVKKLATSQATGFLFFKCKKRQTLIYINFVHKFYFWIVTFISQDFMHINLFVGITKVYSSSLHSQQNTVTKLKNNLQERFFSAVKGFNFLCKTMWEVPEIKFLMFSMNCFTVILQLFFKIISELCKLRIWNNFIRKWNENSNWILDLL